MTDIDTKVKFNMTESFRKNIKKAAAKMSDDQDVIEIPESGGQVLVRKGSQAETDRKDLIRTARCHPFKHEGTEYLICVR